REMSSHPLESPWLERYGIMLYRNGQPGPAIEHLTAAEKLQKDCPKIWLFLALAHGRLGQVAESRKFMAKAVQWMNAEQDMNDFPLTLRLELQLLEGEAKAVLGEARP